jgi:hypothetical protein
MFKKARVNKQTWRAVLVGAAVPIMMFAGAPAVSAAETDQSETRTVEAEQLPGLPGGLPDPTALLDLQACLTELQGLIAQLPPPPVDPPAVPPVVPQEEQLPVDPGAPLPTVPDVGALTEVCKQVVEVVKGLIPPVDVPDPGLPVDPPVTP